MSPGASGLLDQEDAGGGQALDRLWAAWSRRKWLGIVVFLVVVTAAGTLVMALPDVYQSTARVLIEGQQVPERFVGSTVASELDIRLASLTQEVLSQPRLEALITQLGLYPELRRDGSHARWMETAIGRLRKAVKREWQLSETGDPSRRTTIAFDLSYRGADPQKVAVVTNTLASAYVEENLKVREHYASGTTEFLRAQLDEAKKRLDEQEQHVSALRARYLGELPGQAEANMARLESLNSQLRLNSDNQTRLAERRDAVAAQLLRARSESGVEPDEDRLQRLKGELFKLRVKYTDQWPDIIHLKDEIASLEKKLAEPKPKKPVDDTPPTPQVLQLQEALKSVNTEMAILKTEEQRLRKDLATYQARIDSAPLREREFADLTRGYDSVKEMYYTLLKRYGEAQIAENMEQRQKGERFRVLEPAGPASSPAAPNRLRLLLASVGLAAALGAGAIVGAEILDSSFHSVDDLRAFSTIPVLVTIPRIVTETDAHRRHTRFRLATVGLLVVLALMAGGAYAAASGNEFLTNFLSPIKDVPRG
jgi:polysaccharide chain length determinant protein (PEP-CTERM system associated)